MVLSKVTTFLTSDLMKKYVMVAKISQSKLVFESKKLY